MPIIEIPEHAKDIQDFSNRAQETIQRLNEIFWEEIPKMKSGKILKEVNPVIHISTISSGCLGNCSYCIVKKARGDLHSYPAMDIVEDAKRAVDEGMFELIEEVFFKAPMEFGGFEDFENRIIRATHTEHSLDKKLYELVKQRFEEHLGDDGARFQMPMRVDLLQKAVES